MYFQTLPPLPIHSDIALPAHWCDGGPMPTAEAFAVYLRPLPEVRKEGPLLDRFPADGDVRIGTVKTGLFPAESEKKWHIPQRIDGF